LRRGLQLTEPRFVNVSINLVRLAAAAGERIRLGLLDTETLEMILRGNCADATPLATLLGRNPHSPESFIPPEQADTLRREGRLRIVLPVLRVAIAIMWIFTGIVSAGIYPVADSLELLARTGLHGTPALIALYAAAALDIALGIAMLIPPWRRVAYLAQIGLIVFYTAVITFELPEFWLHPYGPVLKNLPLLAAIALLWALEPRHGLRRH
jgi:DoxX-like family